MLEDEWLKWKLRHGSPDALARVYEKYIDAMLTLAMGLLNLALSVEHQALGQKTINGVLCEGIEAKGPDDSTRRIWVAVETRYPILVEIEGMKGGIRTTGTLDQFRWNVDLSAEGVEPEIPAGYHPL
ncbi:MAG: hypothetical protein M1376_10540 [Planctomycetes bacterium]|nr:hypothetical protein [Planctomycetota bacterium]